jgi:hypothetical protein
VSGVTNIRSALEVALNAMSPSLSSAWENAPFTPVTGTAYQKVQLLFAEPVNSEFGRNYRELGYMQVTLFYPLLVGAALPAARAELIRSTFYRGAAFTSSGVTVTVSNTPEVSPGSVDGDRFAIPVKVRFFSNIQ